jgi:CIC family chloride channel protein
MRSILRFISFFQNQLLEIQKRLSSRQFMILSSVLVGLSSGIVAVLLKLFVHSIFQYVTHNKYSDYRFFYLVLPPIGILISIYLTRKLFKNKLKKGLGQIHYALAKRSSFLPRRNMLDQFITSCFTVGFGGSTGLEAPIVITGAAFGSNYSKSYGLNYKQRTILLACGISAGIAAAFNAPIAGVLFALEVLLVDIGISSFTLLIVAAASGALVSKIVLNEGVLLNFIVSERFNFWNLPFYVLLGVFTGIMAVYHSRVFSRTERILSLKINSVSTRWVLASVLLAILIAIFPPLFGEGYESLKILALKDPKELMTNSIFWFLKSNEVVILLFIGLIVFLKSIATGLTIGGGGNGGNFAPSLFIGAYLGYFMSRLINIVKQDDLPQTNFMLVGMAGILSGLYHAPLTAIFLIAEITGGYGLMIPLMIVSSISYFVSKSFEPYPLDSKRLAKKGEAFTSDKDQNVLTGINMSGFIERDFDILSPELSLRELVQIVAHSKRNVFPVIDIDKQFIGIVLLDDIREIMFNIGMYDKTKVIDFTRNPDAKLQLKQSPQEVMKSFDDTGAWILPMFDGGKYEGFISKSNLFSGYRNRLKDTNLD